MATIESYDSNPFVHTVPVRELSYTLVAIEKLCAAIGILAAKAFSYFFDLGIDVSHQEFEMKDFRKKTPSEVDTGDYTKYIHGYGVNYKGEHPDSFVIEGKETKDIEITGINGVGVNRKWAQSHANHLSKILDGRKVSFIHNPHTGLPSSIYRYAVETFREWITPSTIKLVQLWQEKLLENPDAEIIHVAHSEGCAITRNALLLCNKDLKDRIRVIAIAPGCFVDDSLCARVKHLVSIFDFVPYFDLQGKWEQMHTTEYLIPKIPEKYPDHYIYSKTYEGRLKAIYNEYVGEIAAKKAHQTEQIAA